MSSVLIVDDEERMAEAIAVALGRSGLFCRTATSGRAALAAFRESPADLVVTDLKMPNMDGLALMGALHKLRPELPVIVVTAHGDVPAAVAAMQQGAFHFLTKPFDNEVLRNLSKRALEHSRLERENRALLEQVRRDLNTAVVAKSPVMQQLLSLVDRAACAKASVLIQGESGTGKEVIARRLHLLSDRESCPFVAVNCKAFSPGVLESELFGHEKGAFTGATTARAGCFERAHSGTLFLDEIGEVSGDFQGKLLRVLQESEVLRVGGSAPRSVDVRVVAATNKNLKNAVEAGTFREDLYFRLNVIPIVLPPLRERPQDILELAHHFLRRHRDATGRDHHLSHGAEQALCAHDWPGNVRELENAIERSVVLARSDTIEPEDLLLESAPSAAAVSDADAELTLQETLDRSTAQRVRAALTACNGRRAEAAALLGIERTTLYRLIKRHGL